MALWRAIQGIKELPRSLKVYVDIIPGTDSDLLILIIIHTSS
jgi:hypothetical protein